MQTGSGSLNSWGKSIAYENGELKTKSTKYTTVYPSNDSGITDKDTAGQTNYRENKLIYGDSVRENCSLNAGTSNSGWHISSWYKDNSFFPGYYHPVFIRGGRTMAWQCCGVIVIQLYLWKKRLQLWLSCGTSKQVRDSCEIETT